MIILCQGDEVFFFWGTSLVPLLVVFFFLLVIYFSFCDCSEKKMISGAQIRVNTVISPHMGRY